MINNIARSAFLTIAMVGGFSLLTSCSVDQEAAFNTSGGAAKTKKSTVKADTDSSSWQEKRDAAKAGREERRAEAEKIKAKELAAKEAAEEKEEARKQAEEAREKQIAAREEREKEKRDLAEEKAREAGLAAKQKAKDAELAAKQKAKDDEKAAKIAAREKAARDSEARKKAEEVRKLAESGSSSSRERRPFFGGGGSSKYRSAGQDIYVNNKLIGSLTPANAKIEIDISEQKARVFKSVGGHKHLVIETNVSTGKSGHSTSTGTFRIQEKLVAKRSTRYGRWLNSSGATIQSDGDSYRRPGGASSFVGASMPYWMRVTGGIGMHIGYVPNYPASHGCIRVPAEIQPLIYSKVGVGTSVTIRH